MMEVAVEIASRVATAVGIPWKILVACGQPVHTYIGCAMTP
jgi:hypothetical protein